MTRQAFGDALLERLYPESVDTAADPVRWIETKLGDELWSAQKEIATSVAGHRETAVQSANGCGKSFTAGRLAAWWVDSHPIGEALVVATAPTSRQIDAVLMTELRTAHERGGLPGTVSRNEWRVGPSLVAIARKSADYIDAERAAASFQGLHRRFVLVIVDEASGVPDWLYRALPALTTGESSRILLIGNPLAPAGRFYSACQPGSGANVIRISALESPNFTGEPVSRRLRESLPSETWVEEMKRDYGEGSPAYMARVEGRFPPQADDGLISAEWIREAQENELIPREPFTFSADIARSGGDETVVMRRAGGHVRVVHAARGHHLMRTTGEIVSRLREAPGSRVTVDEGGLGSGVVDRLRELRQSVEAFNGAKRPRRPDRYANRRAESYWELREELREGRLDLDPDDEVLAGQLLSIRWKVNSRGLIQIESKEDAARRGISSPDRADALAMAAGVPGGDWMAAILSQPKRPRPDLWGDDGELDATDLLKEAW